MISKENIIAHVITLPGRHDRRMLFQDEATMQRIQYAWCDGVRGTTPAEGISAAHRAVVAMAKAREMDRVLIMEDDVLFTAPGAFDHFLRNVPAEFDLYLGGLYGGSVSDTNEVRWFSGLHCYLVAARFYDRFLAVDPHTHIDAALSALDDRAYYVCRPYACMQRSGFSDNEGKYMDYSAWGKGRTYTGA